MPSTVTSLGNFPLNHTLHVKGAQDHQVNRCDAGLHSLAGAEAIVAAIRARRFVNRLIVGNNKLGDEGCCHLFDFLSSRDGQRYDIEEISLNSNSIGDEGLLSLSKYLCGNGRLRELFLQNNVFTGRPDVTSALTAAVNSSRLEVLSVTSNRYLSDGFLTHFLSNLDAPRLHELHCSGIDLTPISGNTISAYISSPRCRLYVLKCNGNSLGLRAIKNIIRAVRDSNYSFRSIEFYANQLEKDVADSTEDESEEDQEGMRSWADCEDILKRVLLRNALLKRGVNKQSFVLLRCARSLLLRSERNGTQVPPKGVPTVKSFFAFTCLPVELQHYTLSFLAPSLSTPQLVRIFRYASSLKTLPQLLPPLSTIRRNKLLDTACIPAASSIEYALGGTVWALKANRQNSPFYPFAVDRSMGSSNASLDRRDRERLQFLMDVGCDVFELEPGEGPRGPRELYTLSLPIPLREVLTMEIV